MSDRRCPCGCVLTWEESVRDIMRTSSLNYDQAEDLLVRSEQAVKEYREEH